jgi:GntR family transcriptional regulator
VNSLQIRLDFGSSDPIYSQVVEQVKAQLDTGELKPGDQLPTVRQLASELRVNFNTIARAYRLLDEAGLISTQRGRGTYLLEHPGSTAAEVIRQESVVEQLERTVHSLLRQGYSKEEINQALINLTKN